MWSVTLHGDVVPRMEMGGRVRTANAMQNFAITRVDGKHLVVSFPADCFPVHTSVFAPAVGGA